MNAPFQPSLNAVLNGVSMVFLILGWRAIKQRRPGSHRNWMIAALVSSGIFLTSYLIYHAQVGSMPYPHHDWTRPVYFVVLIPHILLAGLMVPFIALAVGFAWRGRFAWHVRITRWLWPVWLYVSVSGIIIYLMLYHL